MKPLPKLFLLFCFLSILAPYLCAYSAKYDIRSLGLRIATLAITSSKEQGFTEVKAVSVISNSMFPQINNTYRVEFDSSYLPKTYSRIIRQSTATDDVRVEYNHSRYSAKASHQKGNRQYNYTITQNTRDFFSLLTLLANENTPAGEYSVDGNGTLWSAKLRKDHTEEIRTKLGKYSCTRYQIRFSPLSTKTMPYVDMVTHNLLKDGNKLTLWVSEKGIPLKAVVRKGVLSMSWEITEILP